MTDNQNKEIELNDSELYSQQKAEPTDKDLEDIKTQEIEQPTFVTFDDMEFLNLELMKGIYEYGFQIPSRIQNLTIKRIFDGKDVIAQSQSGTGKTGAFSIGMLSRIDPLKKKTQGVIISNTKELASQIYHVIKELGHNMKINVELCTGGMTQEEKTANLKNVRQSHVLVGTPGRLNDLLKRKCFNIRDVNLLILDEADILLKDDFSEQIKLIVTNLRTDSQICTFSATYPKRILELAEDFMHSPEKVLLKREDLSLDLISQYRIDVSMEKYKYQTLTEIYDNVRIGQCMIFVNSIEKCEGLAEQMKKDSHSVGMIHGKLLATERAEILKDFRLGKIRVLLSTDLLSRGIDVQHIGLVINYDFPSDRSQYLHRIGRSGRYGKMGIAINFVTQRDYKTIAEFEEFYGVKIVDMPVFETINKQLSGMPSGS